MLDGRYGIFHAFVGDDESRLPSSSTTSAAAGRRSAIAYKPYPACHFMHGSLGATESLLDAVAVEQIDEITVAVPETLVAVVLEPVPRSSGPGRRTRASSASSTRPPRCSSTAAST